MSLAFVAQLAGLTRSHSYQNKWVLVPSQEVGWTLAERLLLEGHNWVNFRFQTPLQLALEAAGPAFWSQGIEACPAGLGPGCLHGLAEHPYSQLMAQPGMDQELWSRLRSCRLEGESWEPFNSRFEALLRERGWADEAMVFNSQASTRVGPDDVVAIFPDYPWPASVRSFLERLPGHRPAPQRVEAAWTKEFFCAGRRDLEFEEVIARLQGPIDRVEVSIAREDASLVHDLLCQYQVPASFACGLPLLLSRPGQALRDFLSWLCEGVSGYGFRELLMSNLIVAPPSSWVAARLLAAAGVRWGRTDYSARLEVLENRCLSQQKGDWQQLQAGEARQLRAWFERLFERFPVNPDGTIPLTNWVDGLAYCVRELLDGHDAEASQVLLEILEDFAEIPGQAWPLSQFRHHLQMRLERRSWSASRPRPGHLHVTTWEWMGLSGRPIVFLTGQEESQEECSELPPISGQVTFSYSTRCRDGERPQYPNQRFLAYHGPGWTPRPVEPLSMVPPEGHFPDLARGLHAQNCRELPGFSEYDGYVPEAKLQPPTSVSGLQMLASCPFQFFLSRGLKIYPEPLPEASRENWLDPMEQGHVLHEMFAGWRGSAPELLEAALLRLPPPPSDWLEERDRRKLLVHFEHFLQLEPRPNEDSACELPFEVFLSLDGLDLPLRGCIDRVDKLSNGLRILDYKTGRTFSLPDEGRYFQGRHLQHALYSMAAEAIFDRPVIESGYLHTHPSSTRRWVAFGPPDQDEVSQVLTRVLQPLQTGAFAQSHRTQEDCRFCHFQAACVGRTSQGIKNKLRSPELKSRVELLETR